ncbi:MAG: alcohol dehydrogenase catalytic domain-containing protein [Streptosporangiaceae bacterium]|nr:alcohol dehydrogenase catalytic domain-containing protein [Streptosporangiaceae bacterium]MBV9853791.1 alcohol dehydrogenase catalytic domain-containing protein [Streptosporangiaceae bacterium]
MKAAVFHAPGDVRIETVAEPSPPGPGDLLIKVTKAAVCGTDSAEWDHGPLLARPPVVLGHEFTGEVVAAGPENSGFPAGARVVSGAGISCGRCEWCAAGRTNLCASYQTLGLHRDGGLAELVLSPASICRAVPDGLDDVGAAMAQPLAVALHAARRGRVGPGRSCAVIGAGGIGAFIVAAAAALGATPLIAVDIAEGRLGTAAALGATHTVNAERQDAARTVQAITGHEGAHVVIEASGAPASPAVTLTMVRRGGDVVIVGLQPRPSQIDLFSVSSREVGLHGTLAHVCADDLGEAVSLLARTSLARTVLGDVIPLADLVERGLRPLAERKANGKIVVDVQGSA